MATIVVVGMAPLPWERRPMHFGLGTRTWQFTKPLLDAGHRVVVIAKMMFESYEGGQEDGQFPSLTVYRLDSEEFHAPERTRRLIEEAGPCCIIGVNMEAASVACRAGQPVPIWADLNGYSMGEAQARHHVVADQDDPLVMWSQVLPVLLRADVFSAVSAPQRCALIGELGSVGRLSGQTFGYEFVHHIPNGVEPPPDSPPAPCPLDAFEAPEDSIWALWSGGFNTWADPVTLADGVEMAMDRVPELRFVSTGGELGTHDPVTYRRFRGLVEASSYRDRFHLMGWVDSDTIHGVMRSVSLGMNVDIPCYETELGARNRLNAMMKYGVPVITTYGSEISRIIERHGIGIVVNCQDPRSLAGAIVWACRNPERMQAMGSRGKEFVLEKFSFSATTKALLSWVASPTFAPDNDGRRTGGDRFASELQRRISMLADIPDLEEDRAELRRIQRTRAFQLYRKMRRVLRP